MTDAFHAKLLRIQFGNSKLSKLIGHISLPSGYTCPFAKECLTFANRKTRKLRGKGEVYCYSASMEARYPAYQNIVWHNFDLINKVKNDVEALFDLYATSIKMQAPQLLILRSGVSGDFMTQAQADAVIKLSEWMPNVLFYAYTKSVSFFAEHLDQEGRVRPNFMVTCSLGGKDDEMVLREGFKHARIVRNQDEADSLGLETDHDDTHAMMPGPSFAQLVHGTQPKGSEWGKHARKNGYNKSTKDSLIDVKTYEIWKEIIYGSTRRTELQGTI
tara:strand:+ start:235 stop:1053 length:819 start_codon:yes stop_codon:yes gene_type:complete